jgi:hypothetical protein
MKTTSQGKRGATIALLVGTLAGAALAPSTAHAAVRSSEVTITSGDATVTFLSESGPDGQTRTAIREHGSLRTGSPVARLVAQRLTPLEIFLALSPGGTAAPAELVQAQPADAARLGRDSAVRTPQSAAQLAAVSCWDTIFTGPGDWYDTADVTYPGGPGTQYLGGVSNFDTTDPVAFGACNNSAGDMLVSYAYNQRWLADKWTSSGTYPLPAGGYYAWYYQWGGYKNGVLKGASYKVSATAALGGSYHLVTGIHWSGF